MNGLRFLAYVIQKVPFCCAWNRTLSAADHGWCLQNEGRFAVTNNKKTFSSEDYCTAC